MRFLEKYPLPWSVNSYAPGEYPYGKNYRKFYIINDANGEQVNIAPLEASYFQDEEHAQIICDAVNLAGEGRKT